MDATLMFIRFLGLILASAKIPEMSKGEQDVKHQFKGKNLLSNPEPLKQLCLRSWLIKPLRSDFVKIPMKFAYFLTYTVAINSRPMTNIDN